MAGGEGGERWEDGVGDDGSVEGWKVREGDEGRWEDV
jgi:hypothetical protein